MATTPGYQTRYALCSHTHQHKETPPHSNGAKAHARQVRCEFRQRSRRPLHRRGPPGPRHPQATRARALTASIVTFGARRPHWREVVLSSSCASERVRRSSQCGGSRDCQSPLQWRRALPCLVSCRNKAFASGCCCLHWAQHMLKSSSWALCGAAGCGAHVVWPSDGA